MIYLPRLLESLEKEGDIMHLSMQVKHGSSGHELGLLGKQILLALHAFRQPEQKYFCHVRNEEVPGAELLASEQDCHMLVFDSLPGILDIKAIGVSKQHLFVELSPLDLTAIKQSHALALYGVFLHKTGMTRGQKTLATQQTASVAVSKKYGARCLWTIPWNTLSEKELLTTIRALDLVDAQGLYLQPDLPVANAPAARPGMRLEQRMDFQLQLIQEQVPVLMMAGRPETQMETRMELSTQLLQLLRFEQLLKTSPTLIQDMLDQDSSPEAQARIAQLLRFKLARDVREAAAVAGRPIDWKQARRLVRRLG